MRTLTPLDRFDFASLTVSNSELSSEASDQDGPIISFLVTDVFISLQMAKVYEATIELWLVEMDVDLDMFTNVVKFVTDVGGTFTGCRSPAGCPVAVYHVDLPFRLAGREHSMGPEINSISNEFSRALFVTLMTVVFDCASGVQNERHSITRSPPTYEETKYVISES